LQWLRQVISKYKIKIECFRCDNAGENKSFQSLLKKKWKHYIKFEYTAPNTPQQNGKIERKFATLYGKIRSLMQLAFQPFYVLDYGHMQPSVSLS
jgi:transposase InsO family protein